MCTYLLKEEDFVPFSMAISHLNKWKQLLQVWSELARALEELKEHYMIRKKTHK